MGNGSAKSTIGRKPLVKSSSTGDLLPNEDNQSASEDRKLLLTRFDLTIPQRKKIVDVWTIIEDERERLSRAVLKRIFVIKPATKALFRLETVPEDQLNENKIFTKTSQDIVIFLGTAVKYLNIEFDGVDESGNGKLIKLAKLFGRDHIRQPPKPGDSSSADFYYWQVFPDAVVEEIDMLRDDYEMARDVKTAWLAFTNDLIYYAKTGYAETKKRNRRQQSTGDTFKYIPTGM